VSAQTLDAVLVLSSSPSRNRAPHRRGVGRQPFADEAKPCRLRCGLIAENRDRYIAGRLCAVFFRLRLGELHRPARVAVLLPQLGRMILPSRGNAAFLDRFLLLLGVALSGAATSVASMICPDMAMKPDARSAASKRANNGSIGPALVSFPRKQPDRARIGTRSASESRGTA